MQNKIEIHPKVLSLKQELYELRRYFHTIPELAFQENKTSAYILTYLSKFNLEVIKDVATTGIFAILKGKTPKPTLLLRADMDALPVEEKTSLEFKSTHKGIHHACGHDGHCAILLIVIKILCEQYQDKLNGTIKFVFQPAEEKAEGAKAMIADEKNPAMKNPDVDFAYGLHLMTIAPPGIIEIKSGYFSSACDGFNVRVIGRGGHGSAPHASIDPIYISTHIIQMFYSILSRNISPMNVATLSITQINGGNTNNVIPSECSFGGNVRTVELKDSELIKKRMSEIVEGAKKSFGCEIEFNFWNFCTSVFNHKNETEKVIDAASEVVGRENVKGPSYLLFSEDFGHFTENTPGAFFLVGAAYKETLKSEQTLLVHHSPNFDFDEEGMLVGASVFLRLVEKELLIK